MSRDVLEQAADAWRAIRLAGLPLARPDVREPSGIVRAPVECLAEMRGAARVQQTVSNSNEPADGVA